eukprot:TRINITY_DN922_c0_g1_i1.p2 TRINITY_DN922_c0_g1~~TRINITY_DN922_c0_g1_i1.p2  ORF type:complete len:205 (-),score=29.26 TRINITY_DN922_c0_g1_i1:846-1460(-)
MAKAKHDSELQVLLLKGEWKSALLQCEEYELELASSSEATNPANAPNYGVQLLLYYLVNDLSNARFLWKRITSQHKSGKPELAAIWQIGQALWSKKYDDIYKTLNGFAWTEPHKTLVAALLESFRRQTFVLLSKSFVAISVPDAAAYLGIPEAETLKVAATSGWAHDSQTNFLSPKPVSEQKEQGTGLTQLQQLTEYFCYLESN